jgi:putative flippase GtrA
VPPGLTRQLVRFAAVGIFSTVAYVVLFLLLRDPLGAQGANALTLLGTAIANTALTGLPQMMGTRSRRNEV